MSLRKTNGASSPADVARVRDLKQKVVAAGSDLSDAPAASLEQSLTALLEHVGNGEVKNGKVKSVAVWVLAPLLAGAVGFGGMKAAVKDNTDKLEAVQVEQVVHEAKPSHSGSASKEDLKAVETEVGLLKTNVGKLNTKLDERATAQETQYTEITDELKWLRRNR